MILKEKILYHQIHPAKLFVDITTGILTTYFLWDQHLYAFGIFFLAPSLLATVLVIRFADLESLKNSPFGRYIKHYMTRRAETIRFIGQIIVWFSSWKHEFWGIGLGAVIILSAWAYGLTPIGLRLKR